LALVFCTFTFISSTSYCAINNIAALFEYLFGVRDAFEPQFAGLTEWELCGEENSIH
jgi:hypothetical protein